jgi:hypothetical protein
MLELIGDLQSNDGVAGSQKDALAVSYLIKA